MATLLLVPQGFDLAKDALLEYIETAKVPIDTNDRETLFCVAKTSLRTKLSQALADQFTDIVTDAVLCIRKPDVPIDLHMVRHLPLRMRRSPSYRSCYCLVCLVGSSCADTSPPPCDPVSAG